MACLKLSSDCSRGLYGPIWEWDVSLITQMDLLFFDVPTDFDGDIAEWDVSRVKNMASMFSGARVFNGDLSM